MKLAFVEEGDGPLVVLLHGFPEDRRAWQQQLPALARAGFRAVAPDLRGYGDSPKPRDIDSYRVPALVEDVAELIESLGGTCVLVGHDWGAFVAWFLAMTRPAFVSRLAILNVPHPAAFARELRRSRSQRFRAAYQLFFQLPVIPELLMHLFGRALMGRRTWRGPLTPMFHYYRALRRTRGELRKLIRPIEVPVLMIWGEDQSIFIEETLTDVAEWVPDLRIERIAHARHFVQHDAPGKVSELLIAFASASSPSRA